MPHIHEKFDFTVSFFVLHPTEDKLAFHFHDKLQLWNNFGGHIELDEDPLDALVREMREETGLAPDKYYILETYDGPKNVGARELPNPFGLHSWKYGDLNHWHIDLPYLIRSKTDELKPVDGESQDIQWFNIDNVREYHNKGLIDDGVLAICEWIFDGRLKQFAAAA